LGYDTTAVCGSERYRDAETTSSVELTSRNDQ
jgi:hypothetical protein